MNHALGMQPADGISKVVGRAYLDRCAAIASHLKRRPRQPTQPAQN